MNKENVEKKGQGEKDIFAARRTQLLAHMQSTGAVRTEAVANAFSAVKRELFVRPGDREAAYADTAMPIGFGQTISQPSTIAVMLEMLAAEPGHRVLEVGSGCGYVLALLSEIVGPEGQVFGIEIVDELKPVAEKNLVKAGCGHVEIRLGDGTMGLPEHAQFDRILISAGCPYVPKPLFGQLKEKGRAVAPVGDRFTQMMQSLTKFRGKPVKNEYPMCCFAFVPLRGKYGWNGLE